MTSDAEGIISFIRGNDELIDDISALNIKVGDNLKYSFNENSIANYYSVIIEDKELNIPVEMANNIFIRI